MEKKLLFGNNISNIGKALSKSFSYFDFKISYCGNTYANIMKNLETTNYDGLFFLVMAENKEVYSFIKDVKNKFPDINIYPLVYNDYAAMADNLMKAGATDCFIIPLSSINLCFSVIYDFFDEDDIIVSLEIAEFLIRKGFPAHVKGFYFFCLCVEKIIDEPEMFTNFSKLLYPYIKEKTGSSIAWIERSIRNLSNMIYKKGIRFENYPDEKNLSNKVMVKVMADEYCRENKRNINIIKK